MLLGSLYTVKHGRSSSILLRTSAPAPPGENDDDPTYDFFPLPFFDPDLGFFLAFFRLG